MNGMERIVKYRENNALGRLGKSGKVGEWE